LKGRVRKVRGVNSIYTEGSQKFPNTVTFLQITVTSSIFNEFVQTLACLVLRNVHYIVYKFHVNRLRIEIVVVVRKKNIKFDVFIFYIVISLIVCCYEFGQRSHEQTSLSDTSIIVRNVHNGLEKTSS
jgi:hypothetical protein